MSAANDTSEHADRNETPLPSKTMTSLKSQLLAQQKQFSEYQKLYETASEELTKERDLRVEVIR